ncbi:MAG: Leucine- isoleucine- valine- threonine- and alanine-binding protein [Rhodocyclaceae bacterium]|nr:MAG: Leucine- isoleucine- valine- threonine- and alanine-binding protein [Rhodocyclaceae bacterium]TNC99960.1 MAG: Leucine-, isoleucine-, valine-, threonine-, and alanine-binding protein [Rhodocyclaceae bacterium]
MQIRTLVLGLFGVALAASMSVQAQVKIGVMASSTGPIAFVGIPQKNAVALLPKKIGDLNIEYITFDDASDPTQSVQLTKKLLGEEKIDALIGPSGSGNAMGVLAFMAEGQTPMLAPVGTSAVVLPMDDKKRWVFKTHPNDDVISEGVVAAMTKRGVKTVGFIGRADPYGENWYKTFVPMAEKAGIKIVANERYSQKDTSVVAQALKLIAAKPDAILVAGVAADAAMPHSQLSDSGYKGHIFQTHGAASSAFIKIGGKKVEGALIVGPLLAVPDEIPDSFPTKKITLDMVNGYEKQFGSKPPIFAAGTYDAGLLLIRAIPEAAKKAKPGTQEFRTALRDALEGTRELLASQGVITMSAKDHSGFDHRGRVLMTVKDGNFSMVKD